MSACTHERMGTSFAGPVASCARWLRRKVGKYISFTPPVKNDNQNNSQSAPSLRALLMTAFSSQARLTHRESASYTAP
jgi:hypothetical protein